MLKRIMAWIMLVGFIGLILNLLLWHYMLQESLILYIALGAYVMLKFNRSNTSNDELLTEPRNEDGESNIELSKDGESNIELSKDADKNK